MVDIYARLDTAHGETGPFVPKMNPEMWDMTMEEVTGHPSANHPITGNVANMQDLTDEEKTWDQTGYGSKTGGSQEAAAKAAAGHAEKVADGMHDGEVGDGTVPDHLQTTEAEKAGAMTQKPIQAPALGPDGDGDVSNDKLPDGDGLGDDATGNKTIQSSPADSSKMSDAERAAAEDEVSKQAQQEAKTGKSATNADGTPTSDPDDEDLNDGIPSKTALRAMGKPELVKFAEAHGVDTNDGTSTVESIIDALYS